ncbi:DUF2345 domain-containing protein, partial [Modicisalibacter sp. MOD 31.J]|uniref:DUF2345 domain-containing protein n=2 Tax=unclassified Modicisalibacter TaxID=2679913 RepID=UPI001CCD3C22
GILLTSGGGYIRVENGNVDIHCPGAVDVKGAQHNFGGPTSLDAGMAELPEGECEKQFAGADKSSSGSTPVGG